MWYMYIHTGKHIHKINTQDWRNGSAVKSPCWSSRGHGLAFSHPSDTSQPFAMTKPGYLTTSPEHHAPDMHAMPRHTCRQNTKTVKIKLIFKNEKESGEPSHSHTVKIRQTNTAREVTDPHDEIIIKKRERSRRWVFTNCQNRSCEMTAPPIAV